MKGVVDAQPGGSLSRMRRNVGDLDILVAAKDQSAVMETFVNLPGVYRVLGKGETKSSIEFKDGLRVQLWVYPPQEFGTALEYATGSKDHKCSCDRALAKDYRYRIIHLKVKWKGEIFCATEEEVYKTLGSAVDAARIAGRPW